MTDYWVSKLFYDLAQPSGPKAEYKADREAVMASLARSFSRNFQRELIPCGPEREPAVAELTETY